MFIHTGSRSITYAGFIRYRHARCIQLLHPSLCPQRTRVGFFISESSEFGAGPVPFIAPVGSTIMFIGSSNPPSPRWQYYSLTIPYFLDEDATTDPESEGEIEYLEEDETLQENLVAAVGEPQEAPEMEGEQLHHSIASLWNKILQSGLGAEVKQEIIKKLTPIQNCRLTSAPKLNREIFNAISMSIALRDQNLAHRQEQLGTSICGLGQSISQLLSLPGCVPVIQTLSDTARILCDLHFQYTKIRRKLIIPELDESFKDIANETVADEYLFGSKLEEAIRKIHDIKAVSLKIKAKQSTSRPPTSKTPGNARGPVFYTPPPQRRSRPGGRPQVTSTSTWSFRGHRGRSRSNSRGQRRQ